MKIAIDCNIFTMQRYGGVSRYMVRLGEELFRMGNQVTVHGLLHVNRYLADSIHGLTQMRHISSFPKFTRRISHLAGDLFTEYDFLRHPPDIIHESYYQARMVGNSRMPRVCTVHDFIHEAYPEKIGSRDNTKELRRKTIERADAIICVSENTRRDLIRLTGVDPDKTHVVYHGYEFSTALSLLSDLEKKHLENASAYPYLLYVGGRNSYKNFKGLLQGLSHSLSHTDLKIIAFGSGIFVPEELELITNLKIPSKNVIQISGSDTLLKNLYRHALAFVYPSYYEGFGLPPLEAMSESCPVLASNSSCIPEIVGDAAIYFEPSDFTAIANAIDSIHSNTGLRNKLIDKGHDRIKHFSWNKCAVETQHIYKSIIGN